MSPEQLLQDADLRVTDARVTLLHALQRADTPLSIKQVCDAVANRSIDQATVYRTVNALLRVGLVRRVAVGHQHEHFELVPADDHHHVICIHCGRVTAVSLSCAGMEAQAMKQTDSFERALYHTFDLYGVCRACAAAGA